MLNTDLSLKNFYLILLITTSILSAKSHAITIPKFTPPIGETVIITNDHESNERARQNTDRQNLRYTNVLWLRHWTHIPEDKRKTQNDEWLLWVPMNKITNQPRANPDNGNKYKNDLLHGVMVRYYFENKKIIIVNEKEGTKLTKNQKQKITSIASGKSYFESISALASAQDYTLNKEIKLSPEIIKKHLNGFEGTIKLSAVKLMWEQEIAEFTVKTTSHINKHLQYCTYNFWVIKNNGRPVNLGIECKLEAKVDGVSYYTTDYISRGYSYKSKPLSALSPKPLPPLQPSGEIKGIEFSDTLGQLIFLTEEYGSNVTWLTFWDINQRKILNSIRQVGNQLHLSESEKSATVISNNRFIKSLIQLPTKYYEFGSVANPIIDSDRKIKSSDLLGLYPVTLNNQNEIEVWNPGYKNISFRKKLKHSSPDHLSLAADGRMVTVEANTSGYKIYAHQLLINTANCNTDIDSGYCSHPLVVLHEKNNPVTINIELEKRHLYKEKSQIEHIQLHPTKPVITYCSNKPAKCGIINYETRQHVALDFTSNADFFDDDKIITDNALYNLSGRLIKNYKLTPPFLPGATTSARHNVVFNHTFRDDHITDSEIHIYNINDHSTIGKIIRKTFPISSITKYDDNNIIYTTGSFNNPQTYILDLKHLSITKSHLNIPVKKVDILDSNWMFVSLSPPNKMHLLLNVNNPTAHIKLEDNISDYSFTGKYFIYSSNNRILKVDLESTKSSEVYKFDSPVHELEVFDNTGTRLVARLNHGVFSLPHINKTLKLPYYGGTANNSIVYNKKTRSFFVSGLTGVSKAFNQNIEIIQQYSTDGMPINEMEPLWSNSHIMTLSNTNELWSGTSAGEIIIRDISSGLIKEKFQAHEGIITNIMQLDENIMTTSSSDGTIKLWRLDITNGKFKNSQQNIILYSMISNDIAKRQPKLISTITVDVDGEFIINSPDGYYWSTPKALHQSSFLNGDEIFDYTQYDFWLNRPDIILDRLGKGSNDSMQLWRKLVSFRQARQPEKPTHIPHNKTQPVLTLSGPDAILQKETVSLSYEVKTSEKKPVTLHVFVNQIPIYGTKGKEIHKTQDKITLDLTPGVNKIRAFVSTQKGIQSKSAFITYNKPLLNNIKSDLYVLSIGVSDYERDEIDLQYASKDASDINTLLSNSQQYNKVYTKIINDKNATVKSITAAKHFLMQSKASDTVVVFFAGHGFLDSSQNYYFGTTDIDPYKPEEKGLNYAQITDLLDGIPSRKKLLMLDTCHSGEVVEMADNSSLPEGVIARGITLQQEPRKNANLGLSFELLQKTFIDLRASTGTIVISAAGGQEFALERGSLRNGVFTSTIIKGLQEKAADTNNDGKISISELRTYTYNEVTRLTSGKQKPTTRNNNLDLDFTIY